MPTGVDAFGRLSIEFKQFGVSLAFVPTVVGDGLINLSVAPEVSSLDQTAGIQLSGVTIPGLKVRRAKTALELRDGEAFAMAGLIQSDFNDTVKAIPLLGKIPIIGALFRSTYFNRNETELVIVVTPHIVKPVRPDQIALPTDRVLQPSDVDILLNGRSEKRGAPPQGADRRQTRRSRRRYRTCAAMTRLPLLVLLLAAAAARAGPDPELGSTRPRQRRGADDQPRSRLHRHAAARDERPAGSRCRHPLPDRQAQAAAQDQRPAPTSAARAAPATRRRCRSR